MTGKEAIAILDNEIKMAYAKASYDEAWKLIRLRAAIIEAALAAYEVPE